MKRRLLFVLHGWLALPIWGLLALVCITGTLSVVGKEVSWLVSPEVRAPNSGGGDALPLNSLADSVMALHPEAIINSVHIDEAYFAYFFRITTEHAGRKQLYVNQYSGQVQGEAQGLGFREFMLTLHGWLWFPWQNNYSVGWYIVTAVSLPLLGSLITGLLVFKRFWRAFSRPRLRFDRGARVFWGDLHRLTGVWSIWFVAIISLSGLLFLVEGILAQRHIEVFPDAPVLSSHSLPVTADGKPPQTLSLDEAVAAAKSAYPDLEISYIDLADHAYSTLTVRGTRALSPLRDTANAVYLNPYTGEPVKARSTSDLSPLQFTSTLLTSLHFGDFAGLASKLIWFVFGNLLSFMICSGFVLWNKRVFSAAHKLRKPKHPRIYVHADEGMQD